MSEGRLEERVELLTVAGHDMAAERRAQDGGERQAPHRRERGIGVQDRPIRREGEGALLDLLDQDAVRVVRALERVHLVGLAL